MEMMLRRRQKMKTESPIRCLFPFQQGNIILNTSLSYGREAVHTAGLLRTGRGCHHLNASSSLAEAAHGNELGAVLAGTYCLPCS